MKKYLFVICLWLSFSCIAKAQVLSFDASNSTTFPNVADTSIVRYWNTDYMVSYIEDDGVPYFCTTRIWDFTGTATSVFPMTDYYELPHNIKVKDMYVINYLNYFGWLLFCGTIDDTVGMCGFYHLKPFYTTLDHLVYFRIDVANCLNRLVATPQLIPMSPNVISPKIVAIGKKNIGSTQYDCIVEVPDAMYYNNDPYNYTYLNSSSEHIDDVLLTDEYVVFVTRDPSLGPFDIRVAPRTNVLGSSMINTKWHPIELQPKEVLYRTHSTELGGDNISVSYITEELGYNYLRERTINIPTMLSGLNTMLSQQATLSSKEDIVATEYLPTTDKLVVLWPEYSHDLISSNVLLCNPYEGSPYTAKRLYPLDNNKYYRICNINDNSFSLIYRGDYFLQKTDLTYGVIESCWKMADQNMTLIKSSKITPINDVLDVNDTVRDPNLEYNSRDYFIMLENCVKLLGRTNQ